MEGLTKKNLQQKASSVKLIYSTDFSILEE